MTALIKMLLGLVASFCIMESFIEVAFLVFSVGKHNCSVGAVTEAPLKTARFLDKMFWKQFLGSLLSQAGFELK